MYPYENPVPDSGTKMPDTSYQQQYAAKAKADDARPLGPSYFDIAAEVKCLDDNAAASDYGQRQAFDRDAVER